MQKTKKGTHHIKLRTNNRRKKTITVVTVSILKNIYSPAQSDNKCYGFVTVSEYPYWFTVLLFEYNKAKTGFLTKILFLNEI